MSDSRKTLFRYSDGIKVSSCARPYSSKLKEKKTDGEEVASQAENSSISRRALCTGKSELSKNGVPRAECEINEVTKRLNIPFDEVVYQDLISLSDVRRKIKCDEFNGFDVRPRRLKKLDPEPDLLNFFQPTKQEFLFCDLLGKNFDLEGADSGCSSFIAQECDGKQYNDVFADAVVLNENRKTSACTEMDLENVDADMCSIEKLRLLHESYGLAPPQPKAYFAGSSLFKRSNAFKISEKISYIS